MYGFLNSLGAGEIIAILVIALIVLGPEKLPDAIRKFGNIYGELRRMSHGFQSELRDAFDEPVRELRGTAQYMQDMINQPINEVRGTAALTADAVAGDPPVSPADPTREVQAPIDEPIDQIAEMAGTDESAEVGDGSVEAGATDEVAPVDRAGDVAEAGATDEAGDRDVLEEAAVDEPVPALDGTAAGEDEERPGG